MSFNEPDNIHNDKDYEEIINKHKPPCCKCNKVSSRKSKKKKKNNEPPDMPELYTTYEPCVHLHFKTDLIDRDCLTHEQYLDLLATPKGYRWIGDVDCQNPELDSKKKKKKKPKKREPIVVRQDGGDFADEFVEDMWDVMSPDITDRLIDFLVNEFGMSVEEAEDFIDCKSAIGKQTVCRKKKSKAILGLGPKHKWVKEFSDVFAKRIEQYIVSMLLTRRTPRVKRIAEKILDYECDLTGEKTTLQNPKTKVQRTMVLIADRLALWIDDLMRDIDKPQRTRPSITEEEEEEEEMPESDEEKESKLEEEKEKEEPQKKEPPKEKEDKKKEEPKEEEEAPPKKDEEESAQPETEEKVEEEEKEPEKEPEQVEEKEQEKEEEKQTEQEKEEEKQPEKEPQAEQTPQEEQEPQKQQEPEEVPEKVEEKEPEKELEQAVEETVAEPEPPAKEEPEKEDQAKPEEEPVPVEETQDKPEEDIVADTKQEEEDEKADKEETPDESPEIEAVQEEGEKPAEEGSVEEKPAEEISGEEKPAEEVSSEGKPAEEVSVKEPSEVLEPSEEQEEKVKEEPVDIIKEPVKKLFRPSDILDFVKEDIAGVKKDKRTDRQKAVKGVVDRRIGKVMAGKESIDGIQQEDIDDAASRVAHWVEHVIGATETTKETAPRKSPGGAFIAKQKTGSTLEVHKLSSGTVAEVTAQVRGLEIPPRGRKMPASASPMNMNSAQEWADWAVNIGNVANEWGKWIESKLTDAEKQMADKKEGTDWKQLRDQVQNEAMKWRVEKERIRDEGKVWDRKIDEKLKHQPEMEVMSTELSSS